MRILHCSDSFWPRTQGIGGIQVWLTQLCRQQLTEGHTVGVVTWPLPGCADRENWNGIEILRWPASDREILGKPEKLQEFLRGWEKIKDLFAPDLVHAHLNQLAAWAGTLGTRTAPSVVTVHVPAEHASCPGQLRDRVLGEAEAIVVASRHLYDALARVKGDLTSRMRVIPYGLPLPPETNAPFPTDAVVFLCLGRLVPEKGFDVALRALACTGRANFRMVVAGEGSAMPVLKRCAAELGVEAQVDFRGWVHPDNVPALYKEATVALMPSVWQEPFGLVALQAAQMGRPVIASRVGGIPEIVLDGKTGWLVRPGDVAALAEAMLKAVKDLEDLALKGREGRQWAQGFTIATCSGQYRSVYDELLH